MSIDHPMFQNKSIGCMVFLVVYVDDVIISGIDQKRILIKHFLQKIFHTKYFRQSDIFFAFKWLFITMYYLSQRKYVLNISDETGILGCKSTDSPMDPNTKLDDSNDGISSNEGRYKISWKALLSYSYQI